MASRERNHALTDQTISKLVGLQSVPMPKDSGSLRLPHHTTSKRPSYVHTSTKTAAQVLRQRTRPKKKSKSLEEKQVAQAIRGKAFIVITWIILAMNVFLVVRNLGYQQGQHVSLEAIEKANGYPLQITMLALAACALSFTTWLCCKKKFGKTINVAVIIFIILSVSLTFLTI